MFREERQYSNFTLKLALQTSHSYLKLSEFLCYFLEFRIQKGVWIVRI